MLISPNYIVTQWEGARGEAILACWSLMHPSSGGTSRSHCLRMAYDSSSSCHFVTRVQTSIRLASLFGGVTSL